MKKTMFALLALGVSFCCFFRGRNAYRISERGLKFKELMYLSDFRLPSDRFAWTCPSSVTVLNQAFKIDQESSSCFSIKSLDGCDLASCNMVFMPSAEEALDVLCDRVVAANFSMLELVRLSRITQDEQGNVLFDFLHEDESGFKPSRGLFRRTYGNVAVEIRLNSQRSPLSAKDFSLPLIEAGMLKRWRWRTMVLE